MENPPDFSQTNVIVLTQPTTFTDEVYGQSYVAASYVKYVEQTGAHCLVIPWDLPWSEMELILKQCQGILLPGGAARIKSKNPYSDRIFDLYTWIKNSNDEGHHFFIWGICLGFEELLIASAGNDYSALDTGFDDYTKLPVTINEKKWKESECFGKMDLDRVKSVFAKPYIVFGHSDGMTPTHFNNHKLLSERMEIIATGTAPNGKEFIAIVQDKKYPFYGVQFHPEKNTFEKKFNAYKNLDRSQETIEVINSLLSTLVTQSREKRGKELNHLDEVGIPFMNGSLMCFPFFKFSKDVPGGVFESIYFFERMDHRFTDGKNTCWNYVNSVEFMNDTIEAYKKVRDMFATMKAPPMSG